MKNTITLNLALTVVLAAAGSGSAQPMPTNKYPTTAPVVSKVVVEETYYFARRDYQPPVPVVNIGQTASYDTPEATVIASISAMRTKNFAWFRTLWDKASQQTMEQTDKQLGQTPEFWQNAWVKGFKDRPVVELTSRIDSGKYVIVAYRLVGADPTVKTLELQTTLKKQGDRWYLTQEAAADPVLAGWRQPETRQQRVARELTTEQVSQ